MPAYSFDLQRLGAAIRPVRVHWCPRLRSTNDHSAALRRRGKLFAPALVLTGAQVAGRGRGTNAWWSGSGCITATLVVAAQDNISLHQLPLVAGLALRNAIADVCGRKAIELKWPNDLVHRGRKLAGILCERVAAADLIGVGLNVNVETDDLPAALRGRATSLWQIAGRQLDKTDVLISLVRALHPPLSRRPQVPFSSVLREYDRYHYLRGRRVSVWVNRDPRPVNGTCQGLDAMGRLLVFRRSEKLRIVSGQVQVR